MARLHGGRAPGAGPAWRLACRYSGIGFGLHNDVVAPYLLRLATQEQKQRWLPGMADGTYVSAIAMTDSVSRRSMRAGNWLRK